MLGHSGPAHGSGRSQYVLSSLGRRAVRSRPVGVMLVDRTVPRRDLNTIHLELEKGFSHVVS